MTTISREDAISAMVKFYAQAKQQLEATGLFGKTLDNKARKLALKLAGVKLPEGFTIAWATPEDWSECGYRTPGRPSAMESGKKVNTYLDAESLAIAAKLGNGNVSEGIRKALKTTK